MSATPAPALSKTEIRQLAALPVGFYLEPLATGERAFRFDHADGMFNRLRKIEGDWVCVAFHADGTASHGNWWPSFKQAAASLTGESKSVHVNKGA
jgi:hypothetical protein